VRARRVILFYASARTRGRASAKESEPAPARQRRDRGRGRNAKGTIGEIVGRLSLLFEDDNGSIRRPARESRGVCRCTAGNTTRTLPGCQPSLVGRRINAVAVADRFGMAENGGGPGGAERVNLLNGDARSPGDYATITEFA